MSNFVGSQDTFLNKSNAKRGITSLYNPHEGDKRLCMNHPKSPWGNQYIKCAEGFATKTPCKEGK
jgi:hypothetical protein